MIPSINIGAIWHDAIWERVKWETAMLDVTTQSQVLGWSIGSIALVQIARMVKFQQRWTILTELGHGGSRNRQRGWVAQKW